MIRTPAQLADAVTVRGCVEVAFLPEAVAVRDTKDRTRSPHTHTPATWRAFLAGVRAGDFARA